MGELFTLHATPARKALQFPCYVDQCEFGPEEQQDQGRKSIAPCQDGALGVRPAPEPGDKFLPTDIC